MFCHNFLGGGTSAGPSLALGGAAAALVACKRAGGLHREAAGFWDRNGLALAATATFMMEGVAELVRACTCPAHAIAWQPPDAVEPPLAGRTSPCCEVINACSHTRTRGCKGAAMQQMAVATVSHAYGCESCHVVALMKHLHGQVKLLQDASGYLPAQVTLNTAFVALLIPRSLFTQDSMFFIDITWNALLGWGQLLVLFSLRHSLSG